MIARMRAALIGTAALLLGAGLWLQSGQAADDKDLAEAVRKIAAAVEKKDTAEAKKLVEALAKKEVPDVDAVMHLLGLRSRKDGKTGQGIGIGPKPGAIMPDGIQQKLEELAKKPLPEKQLADESAALKDAGFIVAAVADYSLAKGPPMDDAKKKALAKQRGKDWNAWAEEMKKAGEELAAAVKDKNADGLQKAAAKLDRSKVTSSCNKCHDVFQ